MSGQERPPGPRPASLDSSIPCSSLLNAHSCSTGAFSAGVEQVLQAMGTSAAVAAGRKQQGRHQQQQQQQQRGGEQGGQQRGATMRWEGSKE
eukprot:223414-Pelagomonas_calceolata.AAC.10